MIGKWSSISEGGCGILSGFLGFLMQWETAWDYIPGFLHCLVMATFYTFNEFKIS